jgi:hypothetical protein
VTAQPWNSIAEGRVEQPDSGGLTLLEARESPCATCSASPCCTHLPLTTFEVTNLVELDHAAYLLNFDRIELGISSSGEWSAYYAHPCRFLDRDSFGCTVHATAAQPRICVHYNPYSCWYKRSFNGQDSPDFVRLDRARFALLSEYITFNDDRSVLAVPAWEKILAMMATHDDQPSPPPPEPSLTDPMIETWGASVATGATTDDGPAVEPRVLDDVGEPCDGCDAYCCSTLVFPQPSPVHLSNLDYFRFCLGFPGVELNVMDDAWALVVKTTCQHLEGGRCSVFGAPERPLICTYYDSMKCEYKPQFGVPQPAHSMRVRLEQFAGLVATIAFDDAGQVLGIPPLAVLRESVVEHWQHVTITEKGTTPSGRTSDL